MSVWILVLGLVLLAACGGDAGQLMHTLNIDGVADFKLQVDSEGDKDRGTIALETGTYMLYCDVPGHRAAGMEATLSVS